jgi:carbonic anhydrase
MDNHCETIVVHCMDYRLQGFLNDWLERNIPEQSYDRVAIAGGVYDVYDVIRQVDIADRLHQIKKVVFINHEDCGAYGAEGSDERHGVDLRKAREKINKLFPQLDVDLFYLNLDGTFEHID